MDTTHKYIFKTLSVTLPQGDTQASKRIQLPKGLSISAAAKPNIQLDKILNIGLYEQGQEINTPIDINFWRDREIGNHMIDGFVPVNSDGSSEIEAKLIAPNGPFNSAITVQIVFVIVQDALCQI